MQISITISGGPNLKQKLHKLGLQLMMFDAAMETIGQQLSQYYGNEAFLSQGGVFGQKWDRLRLATDIYKSRHYAGRPPEVRTGKMMSGFRYEATSTSVRVYNRMPYFAYQDLGTKRLPARQMIGVNKPVMNMIKDVIEKDVNRKLRMS